MHVNLKIKRNLVWPARALGCQIRYSPESTQWAVITKKVCHILLRSPNGNRYTLYAYFDNNGAWNWNYNWLDNDRNVNNPSAVLATLFISPPNFWWSFVLRAGRSNPRDSYLFPQSLLKEKYSADFEASQLPKEPSEVFLGYQRSGCWNEHRATFPVRLGHTSHHSPPRRGSHYTMVGEMHPTQEINARSKCLDKYFVWMQFES